MVLNHTYVVLMLATLRTIAKHCLYCWTWKMNGIAKQYYINEKKRELFKENDEEKKLRNMFRW